MYAHEGVLTLHTLFHIKLFICVSNVSAAFVASHVSPLSGFVKQTVESERPVASPHNHVNPGEKIHNYGRNIENQPFLLAPNRARALCSRHNALYGSPCTSGSTCRDLG